MRLERLVAGRIPLSEEYFGVLESVFFAANASVQLVQGRYVALMLCYE
jgi:hypothetical protein